MRYFISVLLFTVVFSSCKHQSKDYAEIQKMFDTVSLKLKAGYVDTAYLNKTVAEVNRYATKHPKDSLAAKLLFQSAQQLGAHRMSEQAVEVLEGIQKDFSESAYAAKALLTEGFIYNNVIHDYEKAKAKYDEYLSKYKDLDSNISRDVELELQHLGKSADELIKEFEAKLNNLSENKKN
jgi:hypothetical protein